MRHSLLKRQTVGVTQQGVGQVAGRGVAQAVVQTDMVGVVPKFQAWFDAGQCLFDVRPDKFFASQQRFEDIGLNRVLQAAKELVQCLP